MSKHAYSSCRQRVTHLWIAQHLQDPLPSIPLQVLNKISCTLLAPAYARMSACLTADSYLLQFRVLVLLLSETQARASSCFVVTTADTFMMGALHAVLYSRYLLTWPGESDTGQSCISEQQQQSSSSKTRKYTSSSIDPSSLQLHTFAHSS